MLTQASLIITLSLSALALPQRNGRQTAQQQAARIPQGVSQATDGSTILDTTTQINGLPIRYKVSAPAASFKAASGVDGARAAAGDQGTMGINVLLHGQQYSYHEMYYADSAAGDGGQSFFDFPNQNIQANTMGVAVLAPDPNLFWGGGSGQNRVNGAAHAQAVSDLVTDVLPNMVAFNQSNVMFMGVSGGSLMMSGYFIPQNMQNFPNSAIMLACGAQTPMVPFQNQQAVIQQTRIHYQSTVNELTQLQTSIPQSVSAYEQAAIDAGMTPDQIGALQTIDNTPAGGHCAFDEQGFVSGIQLIANNYATIMQPGGDGNVQGVGNVLKTVVGNEQPIFGPERRQKRSDMWQ